MHFNAVILLMFVTAVSSDFTVHAQEAAPAAAPPIHAGATACKLFIKRSVERAKLANQLKCEINVEAKFLKEDPASYESYCSTKTGLKGDWLNLIEANEKEIIRSLSECVEKKLGFSTTGELASDVECNAKSGDVTANPQIVAPRGVSCDGKGNAKAAMCIYQGDCSIKSESFSMDHPFICPIDAATSKCPDFKSCLAFGKKGDYRVRETALVGKVADEDTVTLGDE